MTPVKFPGVNRVLAENQPEYIPLPAHVDNSVWGQTTFAWKLTLRERIRILFTGVVWHTVLTFRQPLQPTLLTTEKPGHIPDDAS